MHLELRCRLCRRPIRALASVQRGYGGECWSKICHYHEAKQGIRHRGHLEKAQQLTTNQIRRGIKSFRQQIALHQDKIRDPQTYVQQWDILNPIEKDRLVGKWEKDVLRLRTQHDIWYVELKQREAVDYDTGTAPV